MATAQISYSNPKNEASAQGNLFSGLKFWIAQRCPTRSTFVEQVRRNGGEVVPLEKHADYLIADPLRKDNPPASVSYKFIVASIQNGKLEDADQYRAGPAMGTIRESSSARPPRTGRIAFSVQDDKQLVEWVQECKAKGGRILGNEIYKSLEARNPCHTWQSWRDRFVKYLNGKSSTGGIENAERPREASFDREASPQPAQVQEQGAYKPQQDGEVASVANTEKDLEMLRRNGSNSQRIGVDQYRRAWEQWADRNPTHTWKEWRRVFEAKILPAHQQQTGADEGRGTGPGLSDDSKEILNRRVMLSASDPNQLAHQDLNSDANSSLKDELISSSGSHSHSMRDSLPVWASNKRHRERLEHSPDKGLLPANRKRHKYTANRDQAHAAQTRELRNAKLAPSKLSGVLDPTSTNQNHSPSPEHASPQSTSLHKLHSLRQGELSGMSGVAASGNVPVKGRQAQEKARTTDDQRTTGYSRLSETNGHMTGSVPVSDHRGDGDALGALQHGDSDKKDERRYEPYSGGGASHLSFSFGTSNTEEHTVRVNDDPPSDNEECGAFRPELSHPTLLCSLSSARDTQGVFQTETQVLDFAIPEPEGGFDEPNLMAAGVASQSDEMIEQAAYHGQQCIDKSTQACTPKVKDWCSTPQLYRTTEPSEAMGLAPSESLPAQELELFIEKLIERGFLESDVVVALKCTSMRASLAEAILPPLKAGHGIPTDIPGVWTPEDDRDLESSDSRAVKRVERKHGHILFNARLEYLGEWRAIA